MARQGAMFELAAQAAPGINPGRATTGAGRFVSL